VDLGDPDISIEDGWFVVSYKGERIGRFSARGHAEKVWRRWAQSYSTGVMLPAGSFNVIPRASREGP
jgi:hypothetical protein